MSIEAEIEATVSAFVADLAELVRVAALEHVRAALAGELALAPAPATESESAPAQPAQPAQPAKVAPPPPAPPVSVKPRASQHPGLRVIPATTQLSPAPIV